MAKSKNARPIPFGIHLGEFGAGWSDILDREIEGDDLWHLFGLIESGLAECELDVELTHKKTGQTEQLDFIVSGQDFMRSEINVAAEFMKFPKDEEVSARTARNRRRIRLTSRGLEEQQRQESGQPPVQLPAAPFEADWADKRVKLQETTFLQRRKSGRPERCENRCGTARIQAASTRRPKTHQPVTRCQTKKNGRMPKHATVKVGRYWIRTSDFHRVKMAL